MNSVVKLTDRARNYLKCVEGPSNTNTTTTTTIFFHCLMFRRRSLAVCIYGNALCKDSTG